LNAYIVTDGSGAPLGVVCKQGMVWRIFVFGLQSEDQPREAFATRGEAGARLMQLPHKNS
jgi:hypothetical protein